MFFIKIRKCHAYNLPRIPAEFSETDCWQSWHPTVTRSVALLRWACLYHSLGNLTGALPIARDLRSNYVELLHILRVQWTQRGIINERNTKSETELVLASRHWMRWCNYRTSTGKYLARARISICKVLNDILYVEMPQCMYNLVHKRATRTVARFLISWHLADRVALPKL